MWRTYEYVNSVTSFVLVAFILSLGMLELFRTGRTPKATLGTLFFIDVISILVKLWQFSTFSGVALTNWNPLIKSVLLYNGIPLFIFWIVLLYFLFPDSPQKEISPIVKEK